MKRRIDSLQMSDHVKGWVRLGNKKKEFYCVFEFKELTHERIIQRADNIQMTLEESGNMVEAALALNNEEQGILSVLILRNKSGAK